MDIEYLERIDIKIISLLLLYSNMYVICFISFISHAMWTVINIKEVNTPVLFESIYRYVYGRRSYIISNENIIFTLSHSIDSTYFDNFIISFM